MQATDLKVLLIVGVDPEAGHEAVDHEVHVCVLAARSSREGLGGVEEQRLEGQHTLARREP